LVALCDARLQIASLKEKQSMITDKLEGLIQAINLDFIERMNPPNLSDMRVIHSRLESLISMSHNQKEKKVKLVEDETRSWISKAELESIHKTNESLNKKIDEIVAAQIEQEKNVWHIDKEPHGLFLMCDNYCVLKLHDKEHAQYIYNAVESAPKLLNEIKELQSEVERFKESSEKAIRQIKHCSKPRGTKNTKRHIK
jgi:hypothetical protein